MAIKRTPSRAAQTRVVRHTDRGALNPRWWQDRDPVALARNVFGVAEAIKADQSARIDNELRCARAYSGQNLESLYDTGFAQALIDRMTAVLGVSVSLNVVKSIVDTVFNKVGKSKVRIQITSKGGDWSVQREAKEQTRFLDGSFDDGPDRDVYAEIRRAFKDALVFGTGVVAVADEDDRPRAERVLPCEIQVSDADAVYGRPRSMFRERYISRDVLAEEFGDDPLAAEAIRTAVEMDPTTGLADSSSDRILVREAWHLPTSEKTKDGLYAVAIEGRVLFQLEWKRPRFPFAFIRASERLVGFWGEGLVEQLLGIQYEITKTVQVAARGLHLMAVPRVFLKPGAQISPAQINNQVGAVVRCTDEPTFHAGGEISDQLLEWILFLYSKAYEISGQSQLGASGQIPKGMTDASGEALRTFNDIESERFVTLGQALEEFTRDIASLILDTAKEIAEDGRDVVVKAKTTRGVRQINFKNLDLDRDRFALQPFPTSFLPQTPAARVQRLQELVDAGWISPERAMSYAQMPDFEDDLSLMSVSVDLTKQQIERMLEDGEDVLPVEYQSRPLALEMVTNAYLRGVLDGAPEAHLEKLQRYLDELDYLGQMANEKANANAGADPAVGEQVAGAIDAAVAQTAAGAGAPPAPATPVTPVPMAGLVNQFGGPAVAA
jgi:hypothetical protein